MKKAKLKHDLINEGKESEIYFPMDEHEFGAQIEEIFTEGHYSHYLPKNGVYLDIGANVGMATLYFANFAKKIYAVEPNPEIFKALEMNTKHLGDKVERFNYAWANGTGRDFLWEAKEGDVPQTFFHKGSKGADRAVAVNCISPTDFFERFKIPHIDLMKIDTEGAEYIIFPDDKFGEVSKNIDAIVGEAHESLNGGFVNIIPELLKEWGYKTTFPKLKRANYVKTFRYHDFQKNKDKKYEYSMSTIFLAKK